MLGLEFGKLSQCVWGVHKWDNESIQNGWFISWKIRLKLGWWNGVALWLRKPPYTQLCTLIYGNPHWWIKNHWHIRWIYGMILCYYIFQEITIYSWTFFRELTTIYPQWRMVYRQKMLLTHGKLMAFFRGNISSKIIQGAKEMGWQISSMASERSHFFWARLYSDLKDVSRIA